MTKREDEVVCQTCGYRSQRRVFYGGRHKKRCSKLVIRGEEDTEEVQDPSVAKRARVNRTEFNNVNNSGVIEDSCDYGENAFGDGGLPLDDLPSEVGVFEEAEVNANQQRSDAAVITDIAHEDGPNQQSTELHEQLETKLQTGNEQSAQVCNEITQTTEAVRNSGSHLSGDEDAANTKDRAATKVSTGVPEVIIQRDTGIISTSRSARIREDIKHGLETFLTGRMGKRSTTALEETKDK